VRRATSGLFLVLGGAYIVAGIALSSAGPLASAGKIATAILLAPLLYLVAPQLVAIFVGIRGAYSIGDRPRRHRGQARLAGARNG
jgi:hypothetical protein